MKINFEDTIKQKSDKELEAISKDHVFYSDNERLIALNELESRNGLSEELLMTKKYIESSIEKEVPITEQAVEAIKSKKQIYKANAVWWIGVFLGGPLVAGYLIAENFKAFNEIDKGKKTWFFAILWTILIFCIVLLIPDLPSNYGIPAITTSFAYFLIKRFQAKHISAYIALGGEPFDWFRTIGVSIIGGIITFALLSVALLLIPTSGQQIGSKSHHELAHIYALKGQKLYFQGNMLGAIQSFDRAIELDSLQPDFFYNRGHIFLNIGDTARSLANFLKSIEIDSTFEAGYSAVGFLLRKQGRFAESVYFERKLQTLDSSGWASYGMAVSYFYVGEFEKALIHLRIYDAVDIGQEWVSYYLGMTYLNLGDTLTARHYLNRATEQGSQRAKDELKRLNISPSK